MTDPANSLTTSSRKPLLFAHISDPHLSDLAGVRFSRLLNKRLLGYLSWRRRRRIEHSHHVLEALHDDLCEQHLDHLLITGDLTHLGLSDEFRQVRRWLDALSRTGAGNRDFGISVVPGNHESYIRETWDETYRHWLPYVAPTAGPLPHSMNEAFPSLTLRGQVAFIGLSSARPTPPFFATGEIGRRQLQKLGALLAKCGKEKLFRVIYLHHPPLPGQEKWRKRLLDAGELTATIKTHGAELVLHGHSHRFSLQTINADGRQIPVIGVPSASAIGWHGEVALYNRLAVQPTDQGWLLNIQSRRFDTERQCFVAGDSHTL